MLSARPSAGREAGTQVTTAGAQRWHATSDTRTGRGLESKDRDAICSVGLDGASGVLEAYGAAARKLRFMSFHPVPAGVWESEDRPNEQRSCQWSSAISGAAVTNRHGRFQERKAEGIIADAGRTHARQDANHQGNTKPDHWLTIWYRKPNETSNRMQPGMPVSAGYWARSPTEQFGNDHLLSVTISGISGRRQAAVAFGSFCALGQDGRACHHDGSLSGQGGLEHSDPRCGRGQAAPSPRWRIIADAWRK